MTTPTRPMPPSGLGTEFFWTGGAHGELRFQRCADCAALLHPPGPICRYCRSKNLEVTVVSGRGRVAGFSVNHRQWAAGIPAPYVVAIVTIDEDPRVHLTTNIVGCEPDDVRIGMAVEVTFLENGDVWLPLFRPAGGADDDTAPSNDEPVTDFVRPRLPTKFEDLVAITGVGMSRLGRRLMAPPLEYTVEACQQAIDDAGLDWSDIDGLSTYPGPGSTGITEGGIAALEDVVRIRPTWFNSGSELPGQTGSITAAMLAVAAGLCRHVLCFRTVWQASETALARAAGGTTRGGATGDSEWRAPFGASRAMTILAANASSYLHRFDAPREVLGWIAVNGRRHAALHPTAIYREPMTIDDYLAAPPIASPFGLYDCDVPVDGAVAIVISARETAGDLRQPPVLVEAVGTQMIERPSWDQGSLSYLPGAFGAAAHLWSRTDLRPQDVDVAELYDGFTFNALTWIEALGFCGRGEAKDFLDGGRAIDLDGTLPLNTHGGQLSHGRLHGYGFVHEAVVQLRGEAGERQVDGARTAVTSAGGLAPAGAILLRTD